MAFAFLSYLLLICGTVQGELFQTCDTTPEERDKILAEVEVTLKKTFTTGRKGFFGTAKNHFPGSNPTTNYGLSEFLEPRAPAGYEDFLKSINLTHTWFRAGNAVNTTFFVGRQDALIWFGCTPPKLRYFHFRTFAEVHTADPVHVPVAGLGDTINNANVNTTGGSNGVDPFNRTAVLISTADKTTLELITSAFESAGISRGAVNLDILPSRNWIRFLDDINPSELKRLQADPDYLPEDGWKDAKADALVLLGRFTGFADLEKSKEWLGSVSQSMIFHRKETGNHVPLAAMPGYRTRRKGTGKSESVFADSLEDLRASLLLNMDKLGWSILDSVFFAKDLRDDLRCILYNDYTVFYGWSSQGFCDMQPRDVSFSALPFLTHSSPSQPFYEAAKHFRFNDRPDPHNPDGKLTERVFVAIGVNHNTYKHVGFNSMMISPSGSGFETPTNSSYWFDDEMEGSASGFGDGFENLFSVAVGRYDTCEALRKLFPGRYCDVKDETLMKPQTTIAAVERIYLEYETQTGPDIEELLQAEFLVFERAL